MRVVEQHDCMTNTILRKRSRIDERNSSIVSRIIGDAIANRFRIEKRQGHCWRRADIPRRGIYY